MPFQNNILFQGKPLPSDSLFFAVKTYHKFHVNRVKIVKRTWGKYAENLLFFSDKNGYIILYLLLI